MQIKSDLRSSLRSAREEKISLLEKRLRSRKGKAPVKSSAICSLVSTSCFDNSARILIKLCNMALEFLVIYPP